MPFSDFTAARGDVVYTTNIGQFRAEQAEVEAVYSRTTATMSDEALKLAVSQERLNRAIAQSGPESLAAGRATLAYRNEVAQLAAAQDKAALATQRAAEKQLAAYGAAARTIGSTLTRYISVPAALVTAVAAKMGIDFQQQMLLIQTQAGASAAEVHKLSGEVLAFAHVAPQGPIQLAEGLYHLESIGLRGAKAMNTLKIASIAAGEGIANLEDVTTALGGVVVTGIKGADNYQHAMNLLIATVGAGNVRFEDLASSIGNVAPAAAAAGVSLPELGAAIATLTDRGFSADEAATRLRISLSLIQSPSQKAKKALADLGIDADTLGGMLRRPNGLLQVLQLLHDKIEQVGKTRGNRDLLAAFGGGRSGLGIQTLVQSLDSPLSSYRSKLAQIAADEKKAAAARQAYLHSEAYQLHAAISGAEADLTKFGGVVAPVFVDVGKGISGILDGFDKLGPAAKIELGVIVGLLAIGGPLLLGIAAVVRAVQTIGAAFKRLPVDAGPAIAATDAELATLRTTAASTGAAAGAELAAGVEAGTAEAAASVSALRLSLLGLGALAIAPIVIPLAIDYIKAFTNPSNDTGYQVKGGVVLRDNTTGKYTFRPHTANRGPTRPVPITAKQAAALGVPVPDVNTKPLTPGDLGLPFPYSTPPPGTGKTTPHGSHPPPAVPFGTRLAQLQNAQLAAQAGFGDEAAADRNLINFLNEQIRSGALTGSELTQAYTALISARSDLASLTSSKKTAAASRKRAYQTTLDVEEQKLKINLDRAKLLETNAGKNQTLLDRAYKAEKKALTAEIDFYRKEAADQELATKERQRYQEKAIAAEAARAKIGQKQSKLKPSDLGAAERDFLAQFAGILTRFAPNTTDGLLATHLYDIKQELRGHTPLLKKVATSTRFPASEYGISSALAAAG